MKPKLVEGYTADMKFVCWQLIDEDSGKLLWTSKEPKNLSSNEFKTFKSVDR